MASNRILALMCGVVAMAVIDLAVVNTALPSIQADLDAEPADLQWVVIGYGVFVAGFLLLGGRMGDLAGHRRVLVGGIALLAAASLVGGLAPSLEVLVGARAAQGLGAALAAPNALAILSQTFAEGPERHRALGIFGAAGGTAAAGSSVLSGVIVQGPGWPWAFFLNVPVGLALSALILHYVPSDPARERRARTDLRGAITLTVGLMAIAFGVHQSIEAGWVSFATLAPLLGGLALLGLFVRNEGRSATPLIPLTTLRKRPVLLANLAAGLLWASFLGLIYQNTLYLQQSQGYSPLATGASTLPIAIISLLVSARVAPALMNRIGAARTLVAGMVVQAAGMLWLVGVSAEVDYLTELFLPFSVIGLGLGLAEVAVQVAALAGVSTEESGLAGGALETSREMGGALGLAVLVSIALSGADQTAEFHRSVLTAAVLAAASAAVAAILARSLARNQ
jgi:EmrB/QacA subfamily drug resistance transporter